MPVFKARNNKVIDITSAFKAKNYQNKPTDVSRLFIERNYSSECKEIKWPVAPIMYEHGLFLKRVIITMWCLGWFNFLILSRTSIAALRKKDKNIPV